MDTSCPCACVLESVGAGLLAPLLPLCKCKLTRLQHNEQHFVTCKRKDVC